MVNCAYGSATRQMVLDIRTDIKDLKGRLNTFENKIDGRLTDLFNHQSTRVPQWIVISLTLLCSLVTALVTILLKGG